MDDEPQYELVLYQFADALVYEIPPKSPKGHHADDWRNLIWRGRVSIVAKAEKLVVRLSNNITGDLFAESPITEHIEDSIERTTDSSRYFALKIVHPTGKHTYIGLGFESRNDAFDFNCTINDYFRKKENRMELSTRQKATMGQGEKVDFVIPGLVMKNREPVQGGIGLPPPPVHQRRSPKSTLDSDLFQDSSDPFFTGLKDE